MSHIIVDLAKTLHARQYYNTPRVELGSVSRVTILVIQRHAEERLLYQKPFPAWVQPYAYVFRRVS